jgi:hypothetical protein
LLTIEASYISARASYGYHEECKREHYHRLLVEFKGNKELVVSDISPGETLSPAELETNIICLLMGRTSEDTYLQTWNSGCTGSWNICMVLKSSPGTPGTFERI